MPSWLSTMMSAVWDKSVAILDISDEYGEVFFFLLERGCYSRGFQDLYNHNRSNSEELLIGFPTRRLTQTAKHRKAQEIFVEVSNCNSILLALNHMLNVCGKSPGSVIANE